MFLEKFAADNFENYYKVDWKHLYKSYHSSTTLFNTLLPEAIEAADLEEIDLIFERLDYNKIEILEDLDNNYFVNKLTYFKSLIKTRDPILRSRILSKLYVEKLRFEYIFLLPTLSNESRDRVLLIYIDKLNKLLDQNANRDKLEQVVKQVTIFKLNIVIEHQLLLNQMTKDVLQRYQDYIN
ncbi:hypothetical protein A3F66_00605 [candidate division TM6 bacterium RIFCSPHIGHO2_12_FULL_32_22]|nr:MAG: hypothetical protein A3F66_00605 [candidate division TM6 bacterium RIFCSPHIGHO2_12_FULL_32_22]